MAVDGFLQGVAEVLALVRAHSEKVNSRKRRSTVVQRWSDRLAAAGGFLFVVAIAVQPIWVSDARAKGWTIAVMLLVGTLALLGGLLTSVIDSVRTTKRPFAEHIDRILESLSGEGDLLDDLQGFEAPVLELARRRLNLESAKVTSRLKMIGGGDGLRASWIGIAVLGFAVLSQYEPFHVTAWSMTNVTLLGLALLLGLSIGGLFVRYGASQSNYYCEIIGLAIERKTHVSATEVTRRISSLAEQAPVRSRSACDDI